VGYSLWKKLWTGCRTDYVMKKGRKREERKVKKKRKNEIKKEGRKN